MKIFLPLVLLLGLPVPGVLANEPKEVPKIDKAVAVEFAAHVRQAISILARRYHRELDEDEILASAVREMYRSAKTPLPLELEKRLPLPLPSKKKDGKESLAEQIERALRDLKEPNTDEEKSAILTAAREGMGVRSELADGKDVERALTHIFGQLDSHTGYMDANSVSRMRALQMNTKYAEVGIQYKRKDKAVVIVTPYHDSAAHKAGIRAGDVLMQITLFDDASGNPLDNPSSLNPADITDDAIEQALWGKPGEKVLLAVEREGKLLKFEVLRTQYQREAIVGLERRADDSWEYVLDAKHGIYYVRLLNYHRANLGRDLDNLIDEFNRDKMKGLILDLRFTGGGLIDSAVNVADVFVDTGLITEFRWRADGSGQRHARPGKAGRQFPIVCLVNEMAGTCTEVVASCLQDHGRAVVMGEKTSGKASLQNYVPVSFNGGMLRITTSHAFRPNGKPLDRSYAEAREMSEWGVTPEKDYVFAMTPTQREALREAFVRHTVIGGEAAAQIEDKAKDAAVAYLRRKVGS